MQIDSLVKAELKKHSEDTIVSISVGWSIGIFMSYKDTNFIGCENPFDIYSLYTKDGNYFLQHIDNFGYFYPRKIEATKVTSFLHTNFKAMKLEKLDNSKDGPDHQYIRKIYVSFFKEQLHYDFAEEHSKVKSNLKTKRYKFLKLLENVREKEKVEEEKRISVKWEFIK